MATPYLSRYLSREVLHLEDAEPGERTVLTDIAKEAMTRGDEIDTALDEVFTAYGRWK